jgi:hypothetical protein
MMNGFIASTIAHRGRGSRPSGLFRSYDAAAAGNRNRRPDDDASGVVGTTPTQPLRVTVQSDGTPSAVIVTRQVSEEE